MTIITAAARRFRSTDVTRTTEPKSPEVSLPIDMGRGLVANKIVTATISAGSTLIGIGGRVLVLGLGLYSILIVGRFCMGLFRARSSAVAVTGGANLCLAA